MRDVLDGSFLEVFGHEDLAVGVRQSGESLVEVLRPWIGFRGEFLGLGAQGVFVCQSLEGVSVASARARQVPQRVSGDGAEPVPERGFFAENPGMFSDA